MCYSSSSWEAGETLEDEVSLSCIVSSGAAWATHGNILSQRKQEGEEDGEEEGVGEVDRKEKGNKDKREGGESKRVEGASTSTSTANSLVLEL